MPVDIDTPESLEAETPDDAQPSGAQAFAAEADAELDKALAASGMLGGDDDEADLHVAKPAKKTKAKADPEPDEAEDDEPEEPDEDEDEESEYGEDLNDKAEDADEDEEDEEDEPDKDEAEDQIDRAYKTLLAKIPGVRMSDLRTLSRAKLIAWAERVEANSKAAEGTPGGAEQGRAAPDDAKATNGKTTPTAEDADGRWATSRKSVAEKLGIDEESADGLKLFHDAYESLRADFNRFRDEVRERDGRQTIDTNLRRLERRYPGLRSDPDQAHSVTEAARALIVGGAAKTAREAFDMAAKAKLGRARRTDLATHRRNGGSQPPERLGRNGRSVLDEDDYWARSLDDAYAGRRDRIAERIFPKSRSDKPKRRLRTHDE